MSLIIHCWQFISDLVYLGTSHQGGYFHDAVVHALQKCGIHHIDTAKRYGCESLLQKAIKESDVKREDLWITTKLWHSDYGYESTKKSPLRIMWKTWCWISWYESLHIAHLLCLLCEYLQRWMNSWKQICSTDRSQTPNSAFIYTFADFL